jgi:hypothetical protein
VSQSNLLKAIAELVENSITFTQGDSISLDGIDGAFDPGRLALVAGCLERELAIMAGRSRAAAWTLVREEGDVTNWGRSERH